MMRGVSQHQDAARRRSEEVFLSDLVEFLELNIVSELAARLKEGEDFIKEVLNDYESFSTSDDHYDKVDWFALVPRDQARGEDLGCFGDGRLSI